MMEEVYSEVKILKGDQIEVEVKYNLR